MKIHILHTPVSDILIVMGISLNEEYINLNFVKEEEQSLKQALVQP